MSSNQFYTVPPEIQEAVNKYLVLVRKAKREGKKLRPPGRPPKWLPRQLANPKAPAAAVAPASAPVAPKGWVTGPAALKAITGK
jgi:hypothetical protein